MRWILVFIFLYLIPLIIVFKNYKNFKRSCIYSSIYVVLVTAITISNIYMSGLNKIEDAMYYQHYASEYIYKNKEYSKPDKIKESDTLDKVEESNTMEEAIKNSNTDEADNIISDKKDIQINDKKEDIATETMSTKTDMEAIYKFKEDIYEIEKIALIPMRDCMPYTKNIAENLKKLSSIRGDLEYAKKKCEEAIVEYKNMETPNLSKEEYAYVLDSARHDLIKTYELREKAMESALNLVDTKNPKYIGRVTEYFKLSDNHITSFKERINDLKDIINNKDNTIEK